MADKLIKERKAFNFYKSYYDVFNELDKKDRLEFITALLDRQFTGIEPNLKGMSNFAYKSQKHSIDSQVKGWEDKTKCKLSDSKGVSLGGTQGGTQGGWVQEKEEGQEEVKETIDYIYSLYPTKCPIKNSSTGKSQKCKDKIKELLKSKTKEDLKNTIGKYLLDCKNSNTWLKNFKTFLNDLPDYSEEEKSNKSILSKTNLVFPNNAWQTKEKFLEWEKAKKHSYESRRVKIPYEKYMLDLVNLKINE